MALYENPARKSSKTGLKRSWDRKSDEKVLPAKLLAFGRRFGQQLEPKVKLVVGHRKRDGVKGGFDPKAPSVLRGSVRS